MQLTFIGSGDAFGTGGRFNTCLFVRHEHGTFLIDCGASSLVALRKAGVDLQEIDVIYLTHLHGDHFGGVPFFLLDAQYASQRDASLLVVGPEGTRERLNALMAALYPGAAPRAWRFPFSVREMPANDCAMILGVECFSHPMLHDSGAPSLGYHFRASGRRLAFTGDTAWTEEILRLGWLSDLLVMECSNFSPGPGQHLDYQTIEQNAHRINAKRIMLTHFGPEAYAQRSQMKFDQAADGLVVSV